MTLAGYAIGASRGVLYLRGEYAYLRAYLEQVLTQRRAAGLLGESVCGKAGFAFDIRIQMGAGAYVCGEETALISSCEGLRGDPKNRPPFPAQRGYLGRPTSVNNVETLCCVPRILEMGSGWFASLGSRRSTEPSCSASPATAPGAASTRSRSDPAARGARAVRRRRADRRAGGRPERADGGTADFDREICFDELATGGALVVFGAGRNPLDIASQHLAFSSTRAAATARHAVSATSCSRRGSTASAPAAANRRTSNTRVARPDGQDRQPLRPRADLSEPGALDAGELPLGLRGAGRHAGRRQSARVRHRSPAGRGLAAHRPPVGPLRHMTEPR